MMTPDEMVAKLKNVPLGTELFVSYRAGRKPTDRAVREAKKAEDLGVNRRWLQGKLERVWTTKKKEVVFTVFCFMRYNEDNLVAEGHYRTINPALGDLISLEVVT